MATDEPITAKGLGQALRDSLIHYAQIDDIDDSIDYHGVDWNDVEFAIGDETGIGVDDDQEIVSLRFEGQRFDLMIIPVEE